MPEKGALEHVKVLDIGTEVCGPYTAAIFGDMGAEVIKIEAPGVGDPSRQNTPKIGSESGTFINFNRSKKGVTLDIAKGKDIFLKMVKQADVVIENYYPGYLEEIGLGYETLKEANPGIILLSLTCYGQTGPYANRKKYNDMIAQAMSGVMSVTGFPGDRPVRCGAPMSEMIAGLNGAMGVLAALTYRRKTGKGQWVDVAMADSAAQTLASVNQNYLTLGYSPQRQGNGYAASAPGGGYRSKDGFIIFSTNGEKNWQLLCEIIGRTDLIAMPEFENNEARVKNRPKIDAIIEEYMMTKTTDALLEEMLPRGFACAPVLTIAEVINHEHISGARQMFVDIDHPTAGKIKVTNQAIKMSATMPGPKSASPLLGQHNEEIFTGLGYSKSELDAFQSQGIM